MSKTKEQIIALVEQYNKMVSHYNERRAKLEVALQGMRSAGIAEEHIALVDPTISAMKYELMGMASTIQINQHQLSKYIKLKNPDGSEMSVVLDEDSFSFEKLCKKKSFSIINLGGSSAKA
jgi:RNase adaptor protein for sRNA GlmZ degradation